MIDKIIKIIRFYSNVSTETEINGDSRLDLDLGLSSFDLIEMICEAEEVFDVQIPSNKMSTLVTVSDVANCIAKLKGGT